VNPGNSGGPLFNLKGEVIGVNSQIFSRSGGFQGLAFAVPIDIAMQVEDQIQHHGKVSHGKLGVTIQEVNQALAQNFGLKSPAANSKADLGKGRLGVAVRPLSADEKREADIPGGLLVEDVAGAAARAGVRPGDVIVAVNNTPVKSAEHFKELVAKSGKAVALLVQRQDARVFIPVPLG